MLLSALPHLADDMSHVLGALDEGTAIDVDGIADMLVKKGLGALFEALGCVKASGGWTRFSDMPRLVGAGGALSSALLPATPAGQPGRDGGGSEAAISASSNVAALPLSAPSLSSLAPKRPSDSDSDDADIGPKLAEDPTRRRDVVNLDALAQATAYKAQKEALARQSGAIARETWMTAPPSELSALGGGAAGNKARNQSSADSAPARSYGFNALSKSGQAATAVRAPGSTLSTSARGGERSLLEQVAEADIAAKAAAAAADAKSGVSARAPPPAWNRERDMAVATAPSVQRPADLRMLGPQAGAGLASRFHRGETYR